jgi:2-phosphosulfolactate phosphatase
MIIRLLSLLEGARQATGTVVIIDVYRAFTTAAVALHAGAARIILVDHPQKALDLRHSGQCDLCFGEVGGVKVPGFDFGNSPHELLRAPVRGKILAQSTSAGTKGVTAVRANATLYVAALINASATAKAVLVTGPAEVSVVAMGSGGKERSEEDELCALYLRNLLRGGQSDPAAIRSMLRSSCDSTQFGDPDQPHFDPRDLDIALEVDSIPFAVQVHPEGDLLVAVPKKIERYLRY